MVYCYNVDCKNISEETETVINGKDQEIEIHYCTLDIVTVGKSPRKRTDRRKENETACLSYKTIND